MLPTITKIYNRSDFTIQLPLAEGYDGQEFRFTIYTCGEIENGWVASYIDGVYTNCSVENDIVIIYVNNNNQMNTGCVTVQSEYDYFNSHFIDNEDNVKDVYKTNIYLVSYKTNAFSAQFRPSNLPDLTGSSEYVTLSYLTTTLEDYVKDEELQSQLEDFITEEDFAAELSNYITDEELTDMGFVTQSDIDQMSYATVAYLNEKLSSKQNLLVSGQNIKTINGYSLLGSGNLVIEGGGSIDLSSYVDYDSLQSYLGSYVTKTELSQCGYVTSSDISDFVTEQDVQNILVDGSYVTQNELSQMSYINTQYLEQASYTTLQEVSQQGYLTENDFKTINGYSLIGEGNIVISGGGSIDLSAYVTKDELSAAGYLTSIPSDYVTESELSSMGYITINDVPVVDLSSYVTYAYLESQGFVTTSDLIDELANYPTNNDLALTLQDYVSYSQFNTYTSDFVVDNDLQDYVSKDELSDASYLTSVPSNYATYDAISQMSYVTESQLQSAAYVTESQLQQAGYLTSIPSNYITESELDAMGYITINDVPVVDTSSYVTKTELSNAGYVTNTSLQSQLQQAGYLTSIPSEYITESELSGMSYITSADIPAIPVIDESIIPNTTLTYTLGDSTYLYDKVFANSFNVANNVRVYNENGGIGFQVGNTSAIRIGSNVLYPLSTNSKTLGTANYQWSYTYSANFIENGTNIRDIYTQAYVLTQSQYDGLTQADKEKETIYIISDQQAYMNNELVTETSLDSRGFLTAANFNYDPTTGTLTLNL